MFLFFGIGLNSKFTAGISIKAHRQKESQIENLNFQFVCQISTSSTNKMYREKLLHLQIISRPQLPLEL